MDFSVISTVTQTSSIDEKKEGDKTEENKKPIKRTMPSKYKKKVISPKLDEPESTHSEENIELFFQCAKDGNEAGIKQLLSLGVAINVSNRYGYTALMRATINGRLNVVDALLEYHANAFLKDHKGRTALHHAILEKQEKAIFKLLAYMSKKKREHLSHNIVFNEAETFNIDAQNMKGESMFMLAARYGHTETAKTLIKQGADIYLKDINGKTAEEQAKDYRESFGDSLPKKNEELYQRHMHIFSFAKHHTISLSRIDETDETDETDDNDDKAIAIMTESLKNIKIDKKTPR